MNRYRAAHTLMAFWPLYLLMAIIGGFWYVGYWQAGALLVFVLGFGLVVSALIVGYGELMRWLDNKARSVGRR
jgi:hypothetical protein